MDFIYQIENQTNLTHLILCLDSRKDQGWSLWKTLLGITNYIAICNISYRQCHDHPALYIDENENMETMVHK